MIRITLLLALVLVHLQMWSQPAGYNYDESKVPAYTLPDPLVGADGNRISDPGEWEKLRAETLSLFARQMYGEMPPRPKS